MKYSEYSNDIVDAAKASAKAYNRSYVIYKVGEGQYTAKPLFQVDSLKGVLIVTREGEVFQADVHKTFMYN